MDAYPSKQKLPISEKPEQNSSLKGAYSDKLEFLNFKTDKDIRIAEEVKIR